MNSSQQPLKPFYVSSNTDSHHHWVISITFNKLSRILRPVHTSALQTLADTVIYTPLLTLALRRQLWGWNRQEVPWATLQLHLFPPPRSFMTKTATFWRGGMWEGVGGGGARKRLMALSVKTVIVRCRWASQSSVADGCVHVPATYQLKPAVGEEVGWRERDSTAGTVSHFSSCHLIHDW